MIKFVLALSLLMLAGCSSLNHVRHEQLTSDSFIIKQRLQDDILCIKKSKTETSCYHITGKGE